MREFFIYWFWPNPGGWSYADPKPELLLGLAVAFVTVSFLLRFYRKRTENPKLRTLIKSWPAILLWFGVAAAFLVICRIETIQFLAMRALWALWLGLLVLFAVFQLLQFRRKYYAVLGRATVIDEREKYLPKRR